jgi:hypothetical protein
LKRQSARSLACLVLASCTFVVAPRAASAQLENFNLNLGYLDNIGRTGIGGGAIRAAGVEGPAPFWDRTDFSLGYFYTHQDWKGPGDLDANLNSVVPEFFLMNYAHLLSIDMAVAYTNLDQDNVGGGSTDTNVADVTVIPAIEVLQFLLKDPAAPRTTYLHAGVLMGYRHLDSDIGSGPGSADLNIDAFLCGPNIVLKHTIPTAANSQLPLIDLYLSPAYIAQVGTGTASFHDNWNLSSGIVTVLGRVDYWISPQLALVTTAQWKHNANQELQPLPNSHEDWGEFGASVRWAINKNVGLRFGYSYTGFNSDYDGHTAYLRIEIPPWII